MISRETFIVSLSIFLLSSCAVLKEPIVKKDPSIDMYRYVVIPSTKTLSSSTGSLYGDQYGTYGSTTTKEINPAEVIEGILLKNGFISVDQIREEHIDETLIVKYGQSGRRDVAGGIGGYTLEVTILITSAKNNNPLYSCTAEGQGATEADDIREAITRCLSGL